MLSEELLDAIYAIATDDECFATLLQRLAAQFGCRSAAFVYGDAVSPAADLTLGYGVIGTPAALARYADYAPIDPAPAAFAALPIGTAAATDRLFSPAVRKASRFLKEFYHPLGLYEALAGPIARADGKYGVLAVHRGADRPPFSDAEIATFSEIASHVARAVALRGRFFAVAKAADHRGSMLERVATGVLVVDAAGQLLEANRAARIILGRGDGLMLSRAGRVRADDRPADAELRAILAGNRAPGPTIVCVPRADRTIGYALRLTAAGNQGSAVPDSVWVVQIAEDFLPAGDLEQTLAHTLGLTRPSAKLTIALINGETLQSYAQQAGISQNTAKFHLRAAFRVTNTRRQSELIRLAVSMLQGLG